MRPASKTQTFSSTKITGRPHWLAFAALVALTTLGVGGVCTITIDDGGNGNGGGGGGASRDPLDQVRATISIHEAAGATQSDVRVRLQGARGGDHVLSAGQALSINGQSLGAPSGDGTYALMLPSATAYLVTVTEPTRGVETTTLTGPADFAITAPTDGQSASLSGFTLTWSGADPAFKARVLLSQSLFGEARTKDFAEADDGGALNISAGDLAAFRQGANIAIAVTKRATINAINGLGATTVQIERTRRISIVPTP